MFRVVWLVRRGQFHQLVLDGGHFRGLRSGLGIPAQARTPLSAPASAPVSAPLPAQGSRLRPLRWLGDRRAVGVIRRRRDFGVALDRLLDRLSTGSSTGSSGRAPRRAPRPAPRPAPRRAPRPVLDGLLNRFLDGSWCSASSGPSVAGSSTDSSRRAAASAGSGLGLGLGLRTSACACTSAWLRLGRLSSTTCAFGGSGCTGCSAGSTTSMSSSASASAIRVTVASPSTVGGQSPPIPGSASPAAASRGTFGRRSDGAVGPSASSRRQHDDEPFMATCLHTTSLSADGCGSERSFGGWRLRRLVEVGCGGR